MNKRITKKLVAKHGYKKYRTDHYMYLKDCLSAVFKNMGLKIVHTKTGQIELREAS